MAVATSPRSSFSSYLVQRFTFHTFLRPSITLSLCNNTRSLPAGTPTGSNWPSSLSAAVTLAPSFLRCHATGLAGATSLRGGVWLCARGDRMLRRGRSQRERAPQPRAHLSLMLLTDWLKCRLSLKSLRRGLNNQIPDRNLCQSHQLESDGQINHP